jgi:plastocyanin
MKYNKGYAVAIGAAAAAIILLVGITTDPAKLSRTGIAGPIIEPGTTTTTTTNNNNTQHTVAVGGGNLTMSINQFLPSTINIHPGESVTFNAPSGATELHNVMLDLSSGTAISSLELAFIMPPGVSPETFQLAPPDNFGEPIIQNMSDGRQSIIALNKVLFNPSVVNQNGNVSYLQEQEFIQKIEQARQQGSLMPPLSANYTLQGTEKIVNSGLILDFAGFGIPEQQQQGGAGGDVVPVQSTADNSTNPQQESQPVKYPILSNFTVTFNEPGAYPFFCAFHPGMAGVVNVTEGNAIQSQTGTETPPA